MGLGSLQVVTLAAARDKAHALRVERQDGDPLEAKRKAKTESVRAAEAEKLEAKKRVTFAEAGEAYVKAQMGKWKKPHPQAIAWWGPIKRYALPVLGHLALNDIQVDHVVAAMRAAIDAGMRSVPFKMRERIELIINAAIVLGYRDATRGNPANLKLVEAAAGFGKRKIEHHRRIKELDDAPAIFRRFWERIALEKAPGVGPRSLSHIAAAAWCLMITCAVRPSEAREAQWREFDFERKLWTIPGGKKGRMKMGEEFVVPLSSLAIAVLESMAPRRALFSDSDAVFSGPRGKSISASTLEVAAKKAGLNAGVPHSWRSVFRDICGDHLDVSRDLAESALAHKVGGTEGSYRRLTAVEKRRKVMEDYARWLKGETERVVVPFPSRA
jgi:integrase